MQQPTGHLSLEEIYNVLTEWMRTLDEVVWPLHDYPDRGVMMSHAESLRHEFARRAHHGDPAKRNPVAVRADEAAKVKQELEAAKNQETWRKRTQMGREWARRPEGGG